MVSVKNMLKDSKFKHFTLLFKREVGIDEGTFTLSHLSFFTSF